MVLALVTYPDARWRLRSTRYVASVPSETYLQWSQAGNLLGRDGILHQYGGLQFFGFCLHLHGRGARDMHHADVHVERHLRWLANL